MKMSYQVEAIESVDTESLCDLYNSVGWTTYTLEPDKLSTAVNGSDYVVVVMIDKMLVGLARALSDDVSILYVQDILVRPSYQGHGIGKALVREILKRYKHVRQKVLLTDDRPEQLKFYDSLGFKNTRTLRNTPLNAFVMIEGVTLS